ncbi:uncharacterized protein ACR2FA_004805 [Aphomia sociella]
MDLKLADNLVALEKIFGSRMKQHEEKLSRVAAGGDSTMSSNISILSSEFSEFKSFVLESLLIMKSQIELLSIGLDRHETFMRRKVLLIHGLPERKDEKLQDLVSSVFSDKLKVDITTNHLEVCHRLGFTENKTRPVLVRFFDMEHRHLVWDNKTSLKGSGITISEFLTKTRHQVFMAARQHFGQNRCWTVEGRIVVLTSDKKRRKIESASELQCLIKQFPVASVGIEASVIQGSNAASPVVAEKALNKKSRRRN